MEENKYYNDYSRLIEAFILLNESKTIVEIGVGRGETTTILCRAATKNNGHVFGFDIWGICGMWNQWDTSAFGKSEVEKFLFENKHSNFTLYKKDTKDPYFPSFLKEKVNGNIDFAFIDGCHSYFGVKADFNAVYPILSKTGIIAFHDTLCTDGGREFMLDLRTTLYDGTYDVFDLFGGYDEMKAGISFLIKKQFPILNINPKHVCGSMHSVDSIVNREKLIYETEVNKYKKEVV